MHWEALKLSLDSNLILPFAFMRPPGLRHRAKYVLNKAVRVHTGADEASYKCGPR